MDIIFIRDVHIYKDIRAYMGCSHPSEISSMGVAVHHGCSPYIFRMEISRGNSFIECISIWNMDIIMTVHHGCEYLSEISIVDDYLDHGAIAR